MVDRRGFIASLLAAPLVGNAAAKAAPRTVAALPDVYALPWLDDLLWFPSREGIYTYRSVIKDPI